MNLLWEKEMGLLTLDAPVVLPVFGLCLLCNHDEPRRGQWWLALRHEKVTAKLLHVDLTQGVWVRPRHLYPYKTTTE